MPLAHRRSRLRLAVKRLRANPNRVRYTGSVKAETLTQRSPRGRTMNPFSRTAWTMFLCTLATVVAVGLARASSEALAVTAPCSLDGTWQIAEGSLSQPPTEFTHTGPVPGLVDLASPPFDSPGSTVSAGGSRQAWLRPADPRREAFCIAVRSSSDQPLPLVAKLKVHKARYGTKVFLKGRRPVSMALLHPGGFRCAAASEASGAGE